MTDDVTLSIDQMDGAWRLMCAAAPHPVMDKADGVEFIFSRLPVSFFNLALLTGADLSAEDLSARGREACTWAAPHDVPWLFMVTHERLQPGVDVAAALDASGLAVVMALTGMRAGTVANVADTRGLELIAPQDDAACASIVDVNGRAYGMDLEASKVALGSAAFWQDQFPVLGLADGTPASAATVMMVDGLRYVALVATEPAFQRRGFAEVAMRQALANAAVVHGERPTVLHATDAGRPVYQRMGYQTIATHALAMEKRFLDGH